MKILRKYIFSLLILPICDSLFAQATGVAQNIQDSTIANTLNQLIPQRLGAIAPGCVVLIAKNNEIIYKKAFGLADVKKKIPMQTNMFFRTGSMGKQYTAVAILQLVEQGKIGLHDSIQRYISNFPSKGYTITIENLLSNTSGIKDYLSEITHPSKQKKHYTPEDGVNYIKDDSLNFEPGTNYRYSNSNFYLLGYIIEKVTGKTFEQYLQENVLDKAGLKNTYYIHPEREIAGMATGYSTFDGKREKAILQPVDIMYSAGALISNVDDTYKWHQALYNDQLIKKETLDKATTPFKFPDGTSSEYAYGWFCKDIDGVRTIEHSGSTDGYQSDAIYLPDQNIFIVALYNCFEADMDWQVLTNDIARIALGKPLRSEVALSEELLKSYVGTYSTIYKNVVHQLIVTLENGSLFIRATIPEDKLPKLRMYANSETQFYIKEASLRFEFVKDGDDFKIVTYNRRGKDAEWIKTP